MIVLLGDSCAGKSTIERILFYDRIISYTSRPIRKNEIDNVDYHFITDSKFEELFENGFFAEHTKYNGWYYGIAKPDCLDNAIAVVEPNGFRQLKRNPDLKITSFYIKVEEKERVMRMMLRGDNVMESFRRIISDQGAFNGIENEVDYVVENPNGQLDKAIDKIERLLETTK